MRLSEWYQETVIDECKSQNILLGVALPFLSIPGVFERCFPNASVSYLSLVPQAGTISPKLNPNSTTTYDVPFLQLHLDLVKAYWSTNEVWKPWVFLEDDFIALRQMGFEFAPRSMTAYSHVIISAASQFVELVAEQASRRNVGAIAVYGRGHWTMNSAASAARLLGLPLYVIERGILPSTYVVDREVPFTAPGSRYRHAWSDFEQVDDWEAATVHHRLTESRWQLYIQRSAKIPYGEIPSEAPSDIFIGQCLFDHNCLAAPFKTPREFLEFAFSRSGAMIRGNKWMYRPHPLSPEEYPSGSIETSRGPVEVDAVDPWERLRGDCVVHTWNSTLGLEAALVFNRKVSILDPNCHYGWVKSCTDNDRRRFLAFLNEISCSV